jgi:ASC-1-like (ASCH) protein
MIELGFEDKFFQDIKNGKKTTIGKIDTELTGIKKGDLVKFFKDIDNKSNSIEKIIVEVVNIHKFNDVPTMLKEMKLKKILPRSRTYKDGEKVFEETYGNRLKDAKFTAFTFDILENTIKAPKGTVLRVSINSKSKEPVINFQPENEAKLHMQERHERLNRNAPGPRINSDSENDEAELNMQESHERFNRNAPGPRIKNYDSENDEAELNMQERHERLNRNAPGSRIKNSGPRIKNKKNNNENDENDENDDVFGPRIKNKKNDNISGPRIKNKKNDDISGPRIKNKKNDDISGPRIKNKKNDNNSPNNANRPPREFEITISEPWFSLIENGQKQVEGRLFKGIFTEFRVNDTIHFINRWNGKEKSVTVKITKLSKYPNFGDLLFHEKLHRVLPGLPNIKCGIFVYNKIYSSFNEIKQHGTIAIEVKVI